MRWLYWLLGFGVDWAFDVGVFGFVDGCQEIKVGVAVLFFSIEMSIGVSMPQSMAYSFDRGHSCAAFRIYSGPSTNLFHLLAAFLWSFFGLKDDASSLVESA